MPETNERLERIHAALAAADRAILDALAARARAAGELRALREADPDRWYALPPADEALAAARAARTGMPVAVVEAIVREAVSATEALLEPPRIAYLGPEGGFAHVAARRRFGAAASLAASTTVEDVIEEVVRGRATHGVVPLESSIEGAHTATLVALTESDARVCGELDVVVTYHLLGRAASLEAVERVVGTALALASCERFLRANAPRAVLDEVGSAVAGERRAAADAATAALVTDVVADASELPVLRARVEDRAGVRVRHALLGGAVPGRSGSDRTLLALALADAPGSLLRALQPFAERGLNLTRLESRPVLGAPWRALFFVEIDGHATDRAVVAAVEEVRQGTRLTKIIGSYPRPD